MESGMAARIARLHRRRGGVDSHRSRTSAPRDAGAGATGTWPELPIDGFAERSSVAILNDLTHTLGLLRSEVRDARALTSNLDIQVRRLFEPARAPRPGGLWARLAAVKLIAHREKRQPADVAKQYFGRDTDLAHLVELKGAVTPAMTGVAGWAAEIAAVVVVDVADNLLPGIGAGAIAQLWPGQWVH
jgi:hypothetical protein